MGDEAAMVPTSGGLWFHEGEGWARSEDCNLFGTVECEEAPRSHVTNVEPPGRLSRDSDE